jgi:dienelactone hydrolase
VVPSRRAIREEMTRFCGRVPQKTAFANKLANRDGRAIFLIVKISPPLPMVSRPRAESSLFSRVTIASRRWRRWTARLVLGGLLAGGTPGHLGKIWAAESLRVLEADAGGVSAAQEFEQWLRSEFESLVAKRTAAFNQMIQSGAEGRKWQRDRREFFLRQIGGLPERTPLNPRVVGTLQGTGYRVEKIILETRPGFHLTANFYLPETPGPWPGVLVPCGHSHEGKAVGQYQLISRLLARNGMAAICYDPVGQGERYQVLDTAKSHATFEEAPHIKTPHPNARLTCTTEHTLLGISSALLGANVAQFRIWDGMRVIDYLQSRPDILADKIGCTGNSGGGTETAYLMALDDRIGPASPGCYLTSFRRLMETRGPQDGEQNVFAQIAFGMDQADYCILRAPKPTLIGAAVRDATFDFAGTMEVFTEAKRFYSRLGYPDRLDIAAPDAPHGFTLQLREAVTRFMGRWLLGKDLEVREVSALPDVLDDEQLRSISQPDWTAAQLQCTPSGQVLLEPGERSGFAINAQTALALRDSRAARWKALSIGEKRQVIRETTGAEDPEVARVESLGSFSRGRATVHKLALTVAGRVRVPALAFVPPQPKGGATLYLHGSSLAADAAPGGAIDALVREGRIVLAAELRGIGETETGHDKKEFGAGRFGPDNLEIFTAYLMGRSFVGMRTTDILAWMRYGCAAPWLEGQQVSWDLVAEGEATIPALHAAALRPELFRNVRLERCLDSWEEIVRASETHDQWVNVVHGALRHYDLPDLVEMAGGERVKISRPVDAMNRPRP